MPDFRKGISLALLAAACGGSDAAPAVTGPNAPPSLAVLEGTWTTPQISGFTGTVTLNFVRQPNGTLTGSWFAPCFTRLSGEIECNGASGAVWEISRSGPAVNFALGAELPRQACGETREVVIANFVDTVTLTGTTRSRSNTGNCEDAPQWTLSEATSITFAKQ